MEQTKKHLQLIALLIFVLSVVNGAVQHAPTPAPAPSSCPRKNFVLVHGAGHGAWCWYKILAPLTSYGYNVTALDLAASGINPLQITDLRTVTDYNRPLLDFLAALPSREKVILVGHSFGGWALTQAMERFPKKIDVAVFLTALMPGPTLNASTLNQQSIIRAPPLMDSVLTYGNGPTNPATAVLFGPTDLRNISYNRSPIEDWKLATTLVRVFRTLSQQDVTNELRITAANYGSVRRVFITSEKDRDLTRDFQQFMINSTPPNEVIEILGSDHMVMISKPIQLLTALLHIARKYN